MSLKFLQGWSQALDVMSPEQVKDFANSLSPTQYTSKKWLVNELCTVVKKTFLAGQDHKVLVLGGWYGSYLVPLLLEEAPYLNVKEIHWVDMDKKVMQVAPLLHSNYSDRCKFNYYPVDVQARDSILMLPKLDVNIVINTSCEHMFDMVNFGVRTKAALYAFQSTNNGDDPGHINPSESTEDLVDRSGLLNIIYQGRIDLSDSKSRFMIIGQK